MGELSMCGPAAIFEKLVSTDVNIHFLSHRIYRHAEAFTFTSSSLVGRLGVVDSSCTVPSAAFQALCWNNAWLQFHSSISQVSTHSLKTQLMIVETADCLVWFPSHLVLIVFFIVFVFFILLFMHLHKNNIAYIEFIYSYAIKNWVAVEISFILW